MLVKVVVLAAAVATAWCIVYVSGGGAIGVLGYLAWSLIPYVLMAGLHYATCRRPLGAFSVREAAWSFVCIAIAGPFLYFDIMFLHPDAQGAIAMLMVPVLQCVGIVVVTGIALSSYDFQNRKIAPAFTNGQMVPANPVLSLLNKSALVIGVLYLLISALQYSDAKTIDRAKEVDFYITQYCTAHGALPTSVQLHERFPGLTVEAGWFLFTDDVTWLKVQYPVKWSNSRALGKSKRSEFMATTYSYILEYHCCGPR